MTLNWQDVGYGTATGGTQHPSPTTVGTLAANPYGLYDVYGNVWEYCLDHQVEKSNHAAEEAVDPVGDTDASVSMVVIKGGGHWDDGNYQFRGGCRQMISRTKGDYYGARLTLNIQ